MELKQIYEMVIAGDVLAVKELVRQAVAERVPPLRIISQYLISAMTEVGARFERGEFFVPEMIVAADAMEAGLTVLKPLLVQGESKAAVHAVVGTVKGDVHDLGKNLVGMMLEGAGFEVRDIGKDVSPEGFVEAVKDFEPHILGMSALLTTTMRAMESTIRVLEEAGVRDKVKIMIGGAPVTQAFAEQIGADGYAPDAAAAADLAKRFVGAA